MISNIYGYQAGTELCQAHCLLVSCSKLLFVWLSSNLLTWVGGRVDEMQNKANPQPALAAAGSGLAAGA